MDSWVPGGDMEARLAQALGISVEQLRAAEESAMTGAIDQAVEEGELAPKAAERMKARLKLRDYVDPQSLIAQALDMTPEQLKAAWDEGKSPWDLMEERDLDFRSAIGKLMSAGKATLQQAVSEGVISQDQADEILRSRGRGRGPFGFASPGPRRFGRGGFFGSGRCGWGRGCAGRGYGAWGHGPWHERAYLEPDDLSAPPDVI